MVKQMLHADAINTNSTYTLPLPQPTNSAQRVEA